MPPLLDRISAALTVRGEQGLLRSLPSGSPAGIDLAGNSYLALHDNAQVRTDALRLAGDDLSGNRASRLIFEASPLARELEATLAAWKKTETALLFNSGYAANVGIMQALCKRDTAVFCDRLNHASIIDGMLLAGCSMERYRHGDAADLAARLSTATSKEKLVVTDTVFSMDGDVAPLADICEVARKHDAVVMVDEAHATGIFGPTGGGLVEELGCETAVQVRVGTLSKAIAGLGGFFAGSAAIRDYLVNFSRSLIYSTGLPPAAIAWDLAAVRYLRAHPGLGAELLRRAARFRAMVRELGYDTMHSTTPIVPCVTGDAEDAVALSRFLRERGIAAPAIRPPTVPEGSSRIRFSMHNGCSESDVTTVVAALGDWKSRHD